jgi:UDP-N-acetylmuramate--alanine ligase
MNDDIDKIKVAYFVGIGGIGMSAIARFLNSRGVRVSGYDRTETTLTKQLEAEGISIHYKPDVELIPKNADLVVYTPAIPDDQEALIFYREHGYRIVKRSDVLQMITASSFNICIAGTHGKTTTTTMIAHLLRDSGYGCNAFLGGISVNYGTNFWSQVTTAAPQDNEKNVCVIEADEYDRSFLKLNPDIAVISAMDPDHLDIYGTAEAMEQAFIGFSQKVKRGGLLISKFGLKRGSDLVTDRHLTYSLQNESADAYAERITIKNGSYQFDVNVRDNQVENLVLHMGGMHNVENAVAAITVASSLHIDNDRIRRGIENFKGVKRRFEYIIKNDRIVFIDDYAHHPEELRALILGAQALFRQRRCTIIFQPHLYSRTKDLVNGFAEVLDLADQVVLLPIYPARELTIEGVSSELILDKMKNENKRIVAKEDVLAWTENNYLKHINKEFGEVLITAGAGDIDTLVEPIKEILENI